MQEVEEGEFIVRTLAYLDTRCLVSQRQVDELPEGRW
jgi:hypothetical protein